MPDFPFTGRIVQNLFNNAVVQPNPPQGANNQPYVFEFSFSSMQIDWGTTLPPSNIRNLTVFQLVESLGTLFRTITFTPSVRITSGQQEFSTSLGFLPTTLIGFTGNSSVNLTPAANTSTGVSVYGVPIPNVATFTNIDPNDAAMGVFEVSVNVYNLGCPFPACSYQATGYSMDFVLDINLNLICEGIGLENAFCSAFCEAPANLTACLADYQTYCLQEGANGDPIITTSVACQEFFKDYITNVGIDSQLDTKLQEYCQAKYAGFDDLLDVNGQRNVQSEIELCACNLNPQLYENLRAALIRAFPAYAAVAENSRCLFPQCVDSPYKNSSTTQRCALPNCINIASISNEGGNIGGITINQGATGCANIVGGTGSTGGNGSGNGSSTKTFLEQHGVWIVLGVGILIVLIIVILIIIAAESDKPKRKGAS